MACLRCRVRPVIQGPHGEAVSVLLASVRDETLDPESDEELEHARPGPGAFLARGEPPDDYHPPRICRLCGSVYYPQVVVR